MSYTKGPPTLEQVLPTFKDILVHLERYQHSFKCVCYLPCLEGFSTFGMICFSSLPFKRVDFNRFVYFPAIVIDLCVEYLYFLKSHSFKKNILKDILHLLIVILVPSWSLFFDLVYVND